MRALTLTALFLTLAGCAHVRDDVDDGADLDTAPRHAKAAPVAVAPSSAPPMSFMVTGDQPQAGSDEGGDDDTQQFVETKPATPPAALSRSGSDETDAPAAPPPPPVDDDSSATPTPAVKPPPASETPSTAAEPDDASTAPVPPGTAPEGDTADTTADVPPPPPPEPPPPPAPPPPPEPPQTVKKRAPVEDMPVVAERDASPRVVTPGPAIVETPPPVESGDGVPIVVDKSTSSSSDNVFLPTVRPGKRRQTQSAESAGQPDAVDKTSAEKKMEQLDRQLAEMDPGSKADANSGTSDQPEQAAAPPPPPMPKLVTKPLRTASDDQLIPSERRPQFKRISVLAGIGEVFANDSSGRFNHGLGFGGTFTWHPAFAGPFSLDASYLYMAHTSTISQVSVRESHHDIAVRLLATADFDSGLFLGGGGGLLLSAELAQLHAAGDSGPPVSGMTTQAGLDGSAVVGFRYGHVVSRFDFRALLRGGTQLALVPTLSVGATF